MATKPTYKFPKGMGACADHLWKLNEKRKAAQVHVDEVEQEISALKNYIIETLPKSEASGIAGKLARVTIRVKPRPSVKDWDVLFTYMKKKNAFDLMQRRLNDSAVAARWEEGIAVPGVEPFNVVSVSLTKI